VTERYFDLNRRK